MAKEQPDQIAVGASFEEWIASIDKQQFTHDPAWRDGAQKGWHAGIGLLMQHLVNEAKHSAYAAELYVVLRQMIR